MSEWLLFGFYHGDTDQAMSGNLSGVCGAVAADRVRGSSRIG
jgi:hypothetical protein